MPSSLDAFQAQLANGRFSWLAEINARAIAARPCGQPNFQPRPVSVHDKEYSELTLTFPYYGFVAASVAGVEFLMYSANDDNVARAYFYYGNDAYEALSLRIWQALSRQARCIYDIGSFTGLYSLIARGTNSSCVCTAFEPMAHIRHRATMNFVLNGRTSSINIEPYALSDATRVLPLYTSVGPTMLDSGGSVVQRSSGPAQSVDLVQAIALDQYMTRHEVETPDLVKIDVEFHEVEVLVGATRTFSSRPTMLIEISKKHTLQQVLSKLLSSQYRVFSIDENEIELYEHIPGAAMNEAYENMEDVHNLIVCPNEGIVRLCLEAAVSLRSDFKIVV